MNRVALGLGANLGDRLGALQLAVDLVCADPYNSAVAVAPVYETDPVGGPDQPDYLNTVLVMNTELSPSQVLELAHGAEKAMGRSRQERWGARTLDVDVLSFGEISSADPDLTLPHPRAVERGFVLWPWADVDPDYPVPGTGKTVAELLAALGDDQSEKVRARADLTVEMHSGPTLGA